MAAPGGRIIIVTWCHRDLSPSEESLRQEEKDLLNRICSAYYLPAWCSTADYVKFLESLSMEVVICLFLSTASCLLTIRTDGILVSIKHMIDYLSPYGKC